MKTDKFDLEINSQLYAKESPDSESIKHKAHASISEEALIERYTIAELEQPKEEETEEADV